jgi:nucleotide-binding universal stress UspA family protein
MMLRPSVLCPIDFSEPSRVALRYAGALAEHLHARLVLSTVNDPLTSEAAAMQFGPGWLAEESERELRSFFSHTFKGGSAHPVELQVAVSAGTPATEILRTARQENCDLIVMSTHGLTGVRKLFFGSTTERVLRETTVPVLVTPPAETGPLSPTTIKTLVRRILVPVDLSEATDSQVHVARRLAETLDVPLLLTHVIEPARFPSVAHVHPPTVDAERRARADKALDALVSTIQPRLKPEAVVVYGDPAEEIAKVSRDRGVGLIVMGLHSSVLAGPRMGSVTYRVLCLAPTLMLALPPGPSAADAMDVSIGMTAQL